MISKELLGVVLSNYGITDVYPSYDESDVMTAVGYEIEEIVFEINIYELAHKCKKWAASESVLLESRIDKTVVKPSRCSVVNYITGQELVLIHAQTEPAAIMEACQWVLDNKDKQ